MNDNSIRIERLLNILRYIDYFDIEKWKRFFRTTEILFYHEIKAQNENNYAIGRYLYDLAWIQHKNSVMTGDTNCLMKINDNYSKIRKNNYFINNKTSLETINKFFSRYIWSLMRLREHLLLKDIISEWESFIKECRIGIPKPRYEALMTGLKTVQQFNICLDIFYLRTCTDGCEYPGNRLSYIVPHLSQDQETIMKLRNVFILSNRPGQISFENRNPDIYRLTEFYEYELDAEPSIRQNPVKHSLRQAQISELFHTICNAMATTATSDRDAFVIYASVDNPDDDWKDIEQSETYDLQPEVLSIATFRPLLLLLDGARSKEFKRLSSNFCSLVCFMSPTDYIRKIETSGSSPFVLMLTSPVMGLCLSCDCKSVSKKTWDRAQQQFQKFHLDCLSLILSSDSDDLKTYRSYLWDPLLQRTVVNYCFMSLVTHTHRDMLEPAYQPSSRPRLERYLLTATELRKTLYEIVRTLSLKSHFKDLLRPLL